MSVLVIGCGYLGLRAARRWRAQGRTITALTRSAERAAALRGEGFLAVVGDVTEPATLAALPPAETVLYAVGYDPHAGRTRREVQVAGLQNALAAIEAGGADRWPRKLIFISTTGVYGQTLGEWVDETSTAAPASAGGRAALEAEQVLAAHRLGARSVILRLAGIYGPGRVPQRAAILAGGPIPAVAEGYLNLIHVDDAVAAVLAADARAAPPALYLASDAAPVVRRAYYDEAARLLAASRPNLVPPPRGSSAAERAASSKRIDSRKLRRELGVRLKYPSYREGLAAALRPAGD